MTNGTQSVPAAWHTDPSGRNQYRYWDGVIWTDWIANDGVQGNDPLIQPLVPSTAVGKAAVEEPVEREKTMEPQRRTRSGYLLLGGDGYPNTEVAGEFARMASIHKAIGRKPRRDEEIERMDLIAALVPEPTNPHDKNAVMVQINGSTSDTWKRKLQRCTYPRSAMCGTPDTLRRLERASGHRHGSRGTRHES